MPTGVVVVAAVYGPFIWLVMSLAVIPLLTGRPPRIAARWWIQLAEHVFFVALPMAIIVAREWRAPSGRPAGQPAASAA